MDLSLGQTSICQDSQIKGAPLYPSLFSQHIKGGIIAKLGLHDVREAVKEQNSKGYNVIGTSRFGASSYGLQVQWVMGYRFTEQGNNI